MQPLDVVFNKPFKVAVHRMTTDHVRETLDKYVAGSIGASERRILFTKWVSQAWEEVSTNHEIIIKAFKKCGISVPIDGSCDTEISVNGLDNYGVESDDDETDHFTGTDEDSVASDEYETEE